MAGKLFGTFNLFIFRNWGQNSLQATSDIPAKARPLPIPRSGSAAPIGTVTMVKRPIVTKRV